MSHEYLALADFPVPVTRPGKVLYPRAGFTKGAMLAYYREIAPLMLPHLAQRPITVRRFPEGVDGVSFYEKRCPAAHPDFVSTAHVRSAQHGGIVYPVVDNLETLLWLANRAAIEFHPFLFQATREDSPTMLVFDLDPGEGVTPRSLLAAAVLLRDLLADMGLRSQVKTSGGKGLHLGVPVHAASFDQTKAFAHAVAGMLAGREPARFTQRMARSERRGRIFVDWSQNDHAKTTVAAYSLRARSDPTVSTPLEWDEVEALLRQRQPRLGFTAEQVLARSDRMGDPFAETLSLRQRLPAGLP
jgi:bifunctional non-homologous end joining protein LigD